MGTGKIDLGGIRNIILDLGGVVMGLDLERTIGVFKELGFGELESVDIMLSRHSFFRELEIGQISGDEFIEKIQGISNGGVSTLEIKDAWNAMIMGFPRENLELLKRLSAKYRLFLLSNTNAIHEVYYNQKLKEEHSIENLDRLFEKVYYSHRMGMRKPDAEIFQAVLNENGLETAESLFVDDTRVHIETADLLGIRTHHLDAPQRLTDVF